MAAVLAAPPSDPPLGAPPPPVLPAFAELFRRAPPRRVVDLTHALREGFPTFDGAPALSVTEADRYDDGGFFGNRLTCHEHVGTHLDAPAHVAPGGLTVDQLAVADLVLPAVVIDLRARAAVDPDVRLTPDDILAFEATHGPLAPGAAVLLWSGWDERAGSVERYRNVDARGAMRFPGFHEEAAIFLCDERGARGIGVDTLSLDHGSSEDFAAHRAWLSSGRWGLENLTKLGELPPVGSVLCVGALKVRGGSGGPARVLALLP